MEWKGVEELPREGMVVLIAARGRTTSGYFQNGKWYFACGTVCDEGIEAWGEMPAAPACVRCVSKDKVIADLQEQLRIRRSARAEYMRRYRVEKKEGAGKE